MQFQVELDGNLPARRVEHASHQSSITQHRVSNLRWLKDKGNWRQRKELEVKKEKQQDASTHPTPCKEEVSMRRSIDKPLLSPQATEAQSMTQPEAIKMWHMNVHLTVTHEAMGATLIPGYLWSLGRAVERLKEKKSRHKHSPPTYPHKHKKSAKL